MRRKQQLLGIDVNPKLKKSDALGQYLTAGLTLAPAKKSGKNLCPFAEIAKCAEPCLDSAGRGQMNSVQQARLRKARFFNEDRAAFMDQFTAELVGFVDRCARNDLKPAVRPNVLADIAWERIRTDQSGRKTYGHTIFELFPDIQFYDYTKRPLSRLDYVRDYVPNYHLTWSYSGASAKYAAQLPAILEAGHNVAVVFGTKKGEALPATFKGYPVIDGDLNDLRFLDPAPHYRSLIVGLRAKGKARNDRSGFVVWDC